MRCSSAARSPGHRLTRRCAAALPPSTFPPSSAWRLRPGSGERKESASAVVNPPSCGSLHPISSCARTLTASSPHSTNTRRLSGPHDPQRGVTAYLYLHFVEAGFRSGFLSFFPRLLETACSFLSDSL